MASPAKRHATYSDLLTVPDHKVGEIVDGDLSAQPVKGALIPGIHVTAVVHAPRGAHPLSCRGRYDFDRAHLREYIAAAQSDGTFKRYLDHYVLGTRDHAEYLARAAA